MSRLFAVSVLGLALFASLAARADERPESAPLRQRLSALDADPALREMAAYERLRAAQSIQAFEDARRSEREDALYLAQRRVEIAETAARGDRARREADTLEQARGELLLQASRREAERARQENERLRVQAQIQAEEAERLRQAAAEEEQARLDAEGALTTVAGQQTAKLSAARQKESRLARQEAELMSGAKLPASKFETRGEVFTLAASSFQSGQAGLSEAGQSSVSALAAYLQANPKARARVDGFGDKQTSGQRRAEALRDALVAAGVPKSRLSAGGKGQGSATRAAEVVVTQ